MAEPSAWALERAGRLILYGKPMNLTAMNANTVRVALALDAARREALDAALAILHDEGWLGRAEQRIQALKL